jgi:hypothetical protein
MLIMADGVVFFMRTSKDRDAHAYCGNDDEMLRTRQGEGQETAVVVVVASS